MNDCSGVSSLNITMLLFKCKQNRDGSNSIYISYTFDAITQLMQMMISRSGWFD